MGGVLLTTAAVATISMFFALRHAVGADIGWSIVLGLVWGVVILNLDRFLVVTMNARGRWWQMTITVLLRLLLAVLVAMVVSMPLVLQIFAGDVNSELPFIAAAKSAQYSAQLQGGLLEKQISHYQALINSEQAVIGGKGSEKEQIDQANVNKLTTELNTTESSEASAYQKWQCETNGLTQGCPSGTSGVAGNGPRARNDEAAYQADKMRAAQEQTELKAATGTLNNDQQEYLRTVNTAQQALATNQKSLAGLQAELTTDINNDRQQNNADHDLLAQIQALFKASGQSIALNMAHWLVTLLFFSIEVLPVGVKTMLLLGPKSAYEIINEEAERQAIDSAREKLAERNSAEVEIAGMEAQALIHKRKLELERTRLNLESAARTADYSAQGYLGAPVHEGVTWYSQDVDKWPQRYIKAMLAALTRLLAPLSTAIAAHITRARDALNEKIRCDEQRAAVRATSCRPPQSVPWRPRRGLPGREEAWGRRLGRCLPDGRREPWSSGSA
jgi:hypothetical protein